MKLLVTLPRQQRPFYVVVDTSATVLDLISSIVTQHNELFGEKAPLSYVRFLTDSQGAAFASAIEIQRFRLPRSGRVSEFFRDGDNVICDVSLPLAPDVVETRSHPHAVLTTQRRPFCPPSTKQPQLWPNVSAAQLPRVGLSPPA
jgi:hypothetical protein